MRARSKISRTLKWSVACLLYVTGILQLWTRFSLRGKAVVLMYHRVLSREDRERTWSHPHIVVTAETFERHMRMIARLFDVVALDQFVAHVVSGEPFRRPSCLITFDDGWKDTYTEAWPILQRHRMSAAVFLPVDYIGSGRTFWQERLSASLFAVWKQATGDEKSAARLRPTLERDGFERLLTVPDRQVRRTIAELVRARKYDDRGGIENLTDRIAALAGGNGASASPIDTFLTWEQVKEMALDGIALGGHGAAHAILTAVPLELAERDVMGSFNELKRRLDRPPVAFSYPNGDWSPAVADMVQRAGYRIAFATARAPFSTPYAVRRINVEQDAAANAPMLLARMAGLF
jgi:peptidoglycan/xylan/chitin deacetylase (PgdA/CDA1 family)